MAFDRRLGALVAALLLIGATANAQGFPGGGGGGGRGGGRGGGGGGGGHGGAPSSSGDGLPPLPYAKQVAASQIDIVGVVKAIGPEDRITIDYEEAPTLDLPKGSRSFVVAKTSLLKDITVGERVRFRLDSQQVSMLAPFDGDRSQLSGQDQSQGGGGGRSGRGSGL